MKGEYALLKIRQFTIKFCSVQDGISDLGKACPAHTKYKSKAGRKMCLLRKGHTNRRQYNQAPLPKYRLENPKPLEILLNLKTEDSTLDKHSTAC